MKIKFKIVILLITGLLLSGCGGANTNQTDRPTNLKIGTSIIPGFSPYGNITDTSPTFTWVGTSNASDYEIGHENPDDRSTWTVLKVTAAASNCATGNTNCSHQSTKTFKIGDLRSWWVRAKVNGVWHDWSPSHSFAVVKSNIVNDIIINEVLAINTHTNMDLDYIEFSDWIELYNPTNQDKDISDYSLSDNNDPLQWKIPNGTTIKANGYLLIWADSKNTANKSIHTNFKLSSKGEKITLYDRSGLIIDSIDFKKQTSDISTSRLNGEIVYMSPTPGKQNSTGHLSKNRSETPVFSHTSGFYNNPISLTLTQINNADVFYTTDGSLPNQTSNKYTQPINITTTSVIRAAALETGGLLSEVKNNTYFINHVSTLPVISFVADPSHLFDPKTGIYTDGDGTNGAILKCDSISLAAGPKNYAQDWERPVYFEYFGENRAQEFILRAGLSIAGECSRRNEKKSFFIDTDKKFGFKSLDYQLYPSKSISKVKKFKLRPGSFGFYISDILSSAIVESGNLRLDYQAYKTIQMYVNGKYWGIYHFRERKGKNFIASNHQNIDKDKLDIIKNGYIVKAGNIDDYGTLVDFITSKNTDLSNDDDYQEVLTMIDEDNYIDYMALMIYSSNDDWIDSNLRCWKEKTQGSKWRWMLDDLDSGFSASNVNQNWFTKVSNSSSPDAMIVLFKSLTKNATFKQKFKSRFTELLNTTLSTDNMIALIDNIIGERKDYLSLEPLTWSSITSDWISDHEQSLRDFANQRDEIVKAQLNAFIP